MLVSLAFLVKKLKLPSVNYQKFRPGTTSCSVALDMDSSQITG